MGYLLFGQEPKVALVGETVLFKRGTPHKFWAAGNEPLHCKGWIAPAFNFVKYLPKRTEAVYTK